MLLDEGRLRERSVIRCIFVLHSSVEREREKDTVFANCAGRDKKWLVLKWSDR